MFAVVVMPLIDFVTDGEEDREAAEGFVKLIQETLAKEVGKPITWDDSSDESDEALADELDSYCMWGLRATAAYLEQNGDLDGFDPGAEPWEHAVFDELEARKGSEEFRQLLHADANQLCYVPVDLEDFYHLTPTQPEEELAEESAEELDEQNGAEFGIGSLPALTLELERVREALGLDPNLELNDELEFDAEQDPLAAAKCGCVVLSARAREATERNTSLIIVWDDLGDAEIEG
ncbi:MAG: hypothetical protein ABI333_22315 [bacterium]